MGLISEVGYIGRELYENSRLQSKKEKEKHEREKLLAEISATCRDFIYTYANNDEADLIVLQLDEIVGAISDEIINKKELRRVDCISEDGQWTTKKMEVNMFVINDIYALENVIREVLLKEYHVFLKIEKEKHEIIKKQLTKKLYNKFRDIIKLDNNTIGIIKQLEKINIKDDLIREITTDADEIEILDEIYYKTLKRFKSNYKAIETTGSSFMDIYNNKRAELHNKGRPTRKRKGVGGYLLLTALELLNIGKKR